MNAMNPLQVIWPSPGRYLLAVSGGADSMVMLHLFAARAQANTYDLVVAHFDHGLRPDSTSDLEFVRAAADSLGLPFIGTSVRLSGRSEASARSARHAWLASQRVSRSALATITAHHQDDLIETSLLNLARGSGRLGLAPMTSSDQVLRPLLRVDRSQLRSYAAEHKIRWREDSTNSDISNPRNFLRLELLPKAPPRWRQQYLTMIDNMASANAKIDANISAILDGALVDGPAYAFARELIGGMSEAVVREVLLAACRRLRPGIQLDQSLVRDVAHFSKTGNSGKLRPMRQGLTLSITKATVNLTTNLPH